MSDVIDKLVLRLAEEDFEDEDAELVKDVTVADFNGHSEIDEWMKTALPKYGFVYRSMGARAWEKERGGTLVGVGSSTKPGCVLMVRYERTQNNRWQNKEMFSVEAGLPALLQLQKWGMIRVVESEFDDEDAELVKDADVFGGFDDVREWLEGTLPELGFAADGRHKWWTKVTGDHRARVGVSTEPGKTFMVLYFSDGPSWVSDAMETVETGKPTIDKLRAWGIISATESEEDDEDDFLIRDVESITPSDVEAGLTRAGFEEENNIWVKRMKKRAITVSLISNSYYRINCYRRSGKGWVFSHRWESNLSGMEEYINRFQDSEIEESEDEDFDDDDPAFEMKDVLGPEDKHELFTLIKTGRIEISGSVNRHSNHYVHENTTSVELNVEYPIPYQPTEQQVEDQAFIQSKMDPEINKLEEEIKENLYGWNRKIYRELEAAYDDYVSEEQVAENIRANDYTFDEEGSFNDGEIRYDRLSPEAQEKAREWWVRTSLENGDNYYSEPVIAEWKWLLRNKGFDGVEISFSGFWSQGDGASFTAKSIDFERYFTGPDPLTFPEQEREQLGESQEEDDDESDAKDVHGIDRKNVTSIRTKSDYAEYEQRVAEFFAREGVNGLAAITDENGNTTSDSFSRVPCDVCRRPLAGTRIYVNGYNPQTREIQNYEICVDCEMYAQYGQLDDTTMMNLQDDPVTEAEEEDFDDVDFREVELDNPTHGMPAGRDKIWSQPATQYHDKFPNNAWEIFVVRSAKPTKKDPRDHRSVFIGILIRTNEGWHQINRNNESWVGPAYQTPSEVVQQMFDNNKDYVWRGLAGN